MTVIEAVLGDLTEQRVDAIVNAANSSLLGGGGVDGAIHSAGGPRILQECLQIRRASLPHGLPTGEAVSTTGGHLPATWVIHTVGPVYGEESGQEPRLLAACHRSSLELARMIGARTVALPAISCGVYGYPAHEAAPIAVAAVREVVAQHPDSFDLVRFVLFGEPLLTEFTRSIIGS